ncbi:DUF3299 domain-containing protein [Hyphomicrobium sp.]|uniref:DUF3299 domain-containing protein n=1 Tax=Hyphomicrobium sp. TaxID=82 RepID=UPI002D7696C9|nr:DUF3299 domain-containing protein [Hyphomicrobium sp.]HET6389199.1 DUF3299 domain-containing protein [Hyphomicrobium sp.]
MHLTIASLARGLLSLLLTLSMVPSANAGTPRQLKWADLIPKAPVAAAAQAPKTFFSGATPMPSPDSGQPPPQLAEGQFMSVKRRQPGSDRPAAVVAELEGQSVSIGGYVVPLDFDATTVKEFLLVPFVGACIHVPPPPANQIIYVKADKGFEIGGAFDPVTVTGRISTSAASTGLADAGYTIAADSIEARKP